MLIDIRGKVNEKRLAFSNTLLPLYEAIVNSIHAIEDYSVTNPGIIEVELKRINQSNLDFKEGRTSEPITDFIITDNGIGFNEDNFKSFNRAHSTYKIKKGGKGIGRFIWLRAFAKAEVESTYKENDVFHKRTFTFEPTENGIENHQNKPLSETERRRTVVRLKNLKKEFQKWCNADAEDIAFKIIEHCFVYFLNKECPRIKIIDGEKSFLVNDRFHLFTKGKVIGRDFSIREQPFKVDLVKLYGTKIDNKIHYCANTREVQNERLSNFIPEMDNHFVDPEGQLFSVAAYVSGGYLDNNVNEERTQISFSQNFDGKVSFPDEVTQEEIRDRVIEIIRTDLLDYISSLSEDRVKKAEAFIHQHPQYRQLLKYKLDDIKKVPSNLSEERFEVELFKIQQRLDLEVKLEASEILKEIDKVEDYDSFKRKYDVMYNKIIEVGNSKLSEYVLHRKLVLDLLDKHNKANKDGKFATEETIHKLIFPLKSFSDDIGFEDHNLWVIDERLAFHKYLSSDKSFRQIEHTKSNSKSRPDILIFNKPFAFASDDKPYSSIVIIEFKRPMRDDYKEDENPISQVIGYAREILQNAVVDKNGKSFDVRANTPMYAYIVCDLTPKLRTLAEDTGFHILPDNDGYFSFNSNYSLYIEIISFDKLIRDSKQRNKALFDKLNLTTI